MLHHSRDLNFAEYMQIETKPLEATAPSMQHPHMYLQPTLILIELLPILILLPEAGGI